MQKDIVKYEQSGVFTEDDKNNWEDFLSSFLSTYGSTSAEEPIWILEEFLPVNIRCRNVADLQNVSDKVQKQARAMEQSQKVV